MTEWSDGVNYKRSRSDREKQHRERRAIDRRVIEIRTIEKISTERRAKGIKIKYFVITLNKDKSCP